VCGTDGASAQQSVPFYKRKRLSTFFAPIVIFVCYNDRYPKMFARMVWASLALSCTGGLNLVTAQTPGTAYQFTMSVTSPAPVPGEPFTITWTGGQPTEAVYIELVYYFPDTPNQNIPYITTDILCESIFPRMQHFLLIARLTQCSKCS
jgi:hypothetical protein